MRWPISCGTRRKSNISVRHSLLSWRSSRGPNPATDASQLAAHRMDALMTEIRALGHIPRDTKSLSDERSLAQRLRKAKSRRLLSESQLAELAQLPRTEPRDASQLAAHRMDALAAVYTERVHGCSTMRLYI